jgi:hypothetical protein
MSNHPHEDTIRVYYVGCSTGDIDLMKSTFAPDVTHYFTDHEPVTGADTLANYWAGFNTIERKAVWTVDRFMATENEAVIEWTMISTFLNKQRKELLRGAEWYQFHEGKIAEIRAYYRWVDEQLASELIGFPYTERGYPTFGNK